MEKDERMRIYAWEFPVRLTHWINFLCILTLSITGFYIGRPFIHAVSSDQYIMGWIRFVHFVAAYTFLMSLIIRLYWAFMGNKFASYKECFPFSARKSKALVDALKFYFFLKKEPPYVAGHTALAAFAYLIVYLLFIFEIVSGFAIYSVTHSGLIWTVLGGWLLNFMYLPTIQLYHHLIMYVLIAFFPLHVYATWYMDPKGKIGLMSSIFSGFKFVDEKHME